jgi:hypothetical protein
VQRHVKRRRGATKKALKVDTAAVRLAIASKALEAQHARVTAICAAAASSARTRRRRSTRSRCRCTSPTAPAFPTQARTDGWARVCAPCRLRGVRTTDRNAA